MQFEKIVPSVFYKDIQQALILFVDCLHFNLKHAEFNISTPYCVLEKDGNSLMVFQDQVLAEEHYPELRIETKNITEVFKQVQASHPHLLHPNLNTITLRPWGAKEFAIKDEQVGIRFMEW
ncbi:MAG: hypothetical protein RLY89_2340 [Bacteroidota bacterium]|jgi:hypothetical protein